MPGYDDAVTSARRRKKTAPVARGGSVGFARGPARRQAALEGVNVSSEMRALERTLGRVPSGKVEKATVRRLRAVERRIDTRRAA